MADSFQRDVHCLLGLPFDAIDMAGAKRRIRDAAIHRERCFFSTPNLNFVVSCLTDQTFRDSVLQSDLSVADGMPLIWMARLLGIPIRERVAGSALFDALCYGEGNRLSVYFFGGPDGAAGKACARLEAKGGSLVCAGYESPGFGTVDEMSAESVIRRINASKADILVVSLGARKGQAWIQRNRNRLEVPVISHLGAVLNIVAGSVRRAPSWMQKSGLEWLWRIKEEPALWRRYFRDGLALGVLLATRVLPHAWFLLTHKADASYIAEARVEEWEQDEKYLVRIHGAWTRANISPLRDCFSRAMLTGKDIKLDMAGVNYVDSLFVGLVMILRGHQMQRGRTMQLASVRPVVRRIVKYCCADFLLKVPTERP